MLIDRFALWSRSFLHESRASLFGGVWFLFGITVGTFKLAYCERLKVGEDLIIAQSLVV